MNWTTIAIIAVIVGIMFAIRRRGQIPVAEALAQLKRGALVVDVRSRAEFDSGHLSAAINIPLDELEAALPKHMKDRHQTLLLHCASGLRSGLAQQKLKSMGYPSVFNLGSYGHAEMILKQAR